MTKADIETKLINKKIQPTAMRILVLQAMLETNTAISLNDIERMLLPADRITIYRTLKTFADKGVVHIITDGTGITKYALCDDDCSADDHHDLHVHFYCTVCNETFCLPDCQIPAIGLPALFKTVEMNLLIKGTCPSCNK